ncbi:MAG: hypothetical protein ACOCV2_05350 [Persicimonas sp.]
MFRTKIALTFAVLTSLLLAGVYFLVQDEFSRALERDAERLVRRSATVQEQAMRLDEFSLVEKARFTATNKRLFRLMSIDEDDDGYERLEKKYEKASNINELRHLAVYHEQLTVDRIRLQDVEERTEDRRNLDLDLYQRRPALPDLFFVLDTNGKGVAALGKDKYRWFGDNVAERHPEVLEAMKEDETKTAIWRWQWNRSDDLRLYRVAIVPIRPTPSEEPAGVVVTGNVIGDGYAKQGQDLMSGVTTPDTDDETVRESDFESAPEIAFFHDSYIVGSTFSSGEQRVLKKELFEKLDVLAKDEPEKLLELEIDGETYVGLVRYFAGEFNEDKDDRGTGFVVLTSLDEAKAPIDRALTNVWFLGGVIILIGVILLLLFIQRFIAPAERIEDGIGEILAGNKDYTFEVDEDHQIFSSMAQGLNLMSAYLQGKPMPDDVEEIEGWGGLIGDQGDSSQSGGESQVQGVAMPGMGGGSDDEESEGEAEEDEDDS